MQEQQQQQQQQQEMVISAGHARGMIMCPTVGMTRLARNPGYGPVITAASAPASGSFHGLPPTGAAGEAVVWVPMTMMTQQAAAQWASNPTTSAVPADDSLWDTTWECVWGPPNWPRCSILGAAALPAPVEDSHEPRAKVGKQQHQKNSATAASGVVDEKKTRRGGKIKKNDAVLVEEATTTDDARVGAGEDIHEPRLDDADGSAPSKEEAEDTEEEGVVAAVEKKKRTRRSRKKGKGAAVTEGNGNDTTEAAGEDHDEELLEGKEKGDVEQKTTEEDPPPAKKKPLPPVELIEVEGQMVPSLGSVNHELGTCKLCCFFPKGRCRNGTDCPFCHFEHEPRKRVKRKKGSVATTNEEDDDEEEEESEKEEEVEEKVGEDTEEEEETTTDEDEQTTPLVSDRETSEVGEDAAVALKTPQKTIISKSGLKAKEEPLSLSELLIKSSAKVEELAGSKENKEEEASTSADDGSATYGEDESEPEGEDSALASSSASATSEATPGLPSSASESSEEDEESAPPKEPLTPAKWMKKEEVNTVQRLEKDAEQRLAEGALRILRYFMDDSDLVSACKDWETRIQTAPEAQAKAALKGLLVAGLEDVRQASGVRGLASGLLDEGCVTKAGLRRVLKELKLEGASEDFALDNPKAPELLAELEGLAKKTSPKLAPVGTTKTKTIARGGTAATTTAAPTTTASYPWRAAAKPNSTSPRSDVDESPVSPTSPRTPPPKQEQHSRQLFAAVAAADPDPEVPQSDKEVSRSIKSILNKLTVEKFDRLTEKLLTGGLLRTAEHLEILTSEVFAKATTQHHFIDMYSDLCVRVDSHLASRKDAPPFRKILLNECQRCFEKCLKAPGGTSPNIKITGPPLTEEELVEAKAYYKVRMLGNMKFVGHLLAKKMLASRVLLMVSEELLTHEDEALELLSALLTIAAPSFELDKTWSHRTHLWDIMDRFRKRAEAPGLAPRLRCILRDMLDLRTAGWDVKHIKAGQQAMKREAPKRLSEVRQAWRNDYAEEVR